MQHSKPNITMHEMTAVMNAVNNGHLADGVLNAEFEGLFTAMYGYPHVVSLNSGTSAMHLALLAMGVGPGDEVIVTPYTMVATVNVILAVGATPVFADIERDTYNLSADCVAQKVTNKTKAVMPVDLFGVPADILAIRNVIPDHVKILEDSIEALGSVYQGKPVGTHADAGAFGFYPNKQITTCEGGILYSKDKDLIDKVRRLSRHGVMTGDLSYQSMGYNMRLSDLHAALGIAQLQRFHDMQKRLDEVAADLDAYFLDLRKQATRPGDKGTHFIYSIELPKHVNKEEFIRVMGADYQIPVKPYFNVLHTLKHLQPYASPCPVAEEVGARTVALPFHSGITQQNILHIVESFGRYVYD